MFNIVRFTRRTCPALALTLALTSCDSSTNEALTSFLTGIHPRNTSSSRPSSSK